MTTLGNNHKTILFFWGGVTTRTQLKARIKADFES